MQLDQQFTGPLAYLTGEYPRATDTFIQREVAALRALGIDVQTFSIRRTDASHHVGPEQRNEAAKTFHVLEASKSITRLIKSHVGWIKRKPKNYLSALRLAWSTAPNGMKNGLFQLFYFLEAGVLADEMRLRGVRHLHNHIAKSSCTVAMLASRISGIPYSFTLHGPDIFFEPYHWRLDTKIATASFVACISDFCRSQAMVFSEPSHWAKLHIVHCGVDPSRYTKADKPQSRNLLFVGRLAGVKGVPVLFDALALVAKRYPDTHLTLIGDGPEREKLELLATKLGIKQSVTFAGYQSQSEVATHLAQTDVFVLPSFAEGVPVVLMEAMAAQVPVVTTRIAGIPELVRDGESGYLVAPGDTEELRDGINKLLDDPNLREKMGVLGRTRVVEHYASDVEAARLAQLFTAVSNNHNHPKIRPEPIR